MKAEIMSVDCQSIQQHLLEEDGSELSPRQTRHIAECAACAEIQRDAAQTGALLAAVGSQIRQSDAFALPLALDGRVRRQVMDRLAQPVASAAVARRIEMDSEPSRGWLESLRALLWRSRWAMAATVIILLLGFSGFRLVAHRPIGALEFAAGTTLLGHASGAQPHTGVGEWACREGSSLTTREGSMALFSLGGAVRAAMRPSTSIQVASVRKINLKEGSVWLRVTHGGKGFAVQTPAALVTVTGTSFGVTVDGQGSTHVEVAEGGVAVTQAAAADKVTAGYAMTAGSGGIEAPVVRSEGKQLPAWVEALLGAEKIAHAGSYLPSVSMH